MRPSVDLICSFCAVRSVSGATHAGRCCGVKATADVRAQAPTMHVLSIIGKDQLRERARARSDFGESIYRNFIILRKFTTSKMWRVIILLKFWAAELWQNVPIPVAR